MSRRGRRTADPELVRCRGALSGRLLAAAGIAGAACEPRERENAAAAADGSTRLPDLGMQLHANSGPPVSRSSIAMQPWIPTVTRDDFFQASSLRDADNAAFGGSLRNVQLPTPCRPVSGAVFAAVVDMASSRVVGDGGLHAAGAFSAGRGI